MQTIDPTDPNANRFAIYAAAAFIEAHPEQYSFHEIFTPYCRTNVGCALGWVGYFAGGEFHRRLVGDIAREIVGKESLDFYDSLSELTFYNVETTSWHTDARKAARALRLYAEVAYPFQHRSRRP